VDILNWTIVKLIKELESLFNKYNITQPRISAEVLLGEVLNLKRVELYLQQDRPMVATELEQLRSLTRRRLKHEPLQYITQKAYFRNLELFVDARVLIPRPETEMLVEHALRHLQENANILDIGTGSGTIALSMATERPDASITAIDNSAEALEVAKINWNKINSPNNICFKLSDMNNPEFHNQFSKHFDIIISNPPYIAENQWNSLPSEVKNYEPKNALLGGKDGLDFIKAIFDIAPKMLKSGGKLFFEFGDGQSEDVEKFGSELGCFSRLELMPDLTGKKRIFFGELIWSKNDACSDFH